MNIANFGSSDEQQVVEQVVTLVQAELPLGDGLRAAASETSNRRLAKALREIASAVDAGQSLSEAIAGQSPAIPESLATLLTASERSGRLREGLLDLIEHDVSTQETLRAAYGALVYPAALLAFAYGCFLFLLWFVVGALVQMYNEFELDLPPATRVVADVRALGPWLVIGPLGLLLGAVVVVRILSPARRQRVLATIPMFGSMFHWCGVAQATRALGHLVRQQVPLPEALQLSSQGLRDANVAEVWRNLALEVQQGRTLSQSLAETYRVPASMAPLIGSGERQGDLAEALFLASEMLEGRVRLRAQLARSVLPPILFIIVGGGAYFLVIALLSPMLSLIQNLSG